MGRNFGIIFYIFIDNQIQQLSKKERRQLKREEKLAQREQAARARSTRRFATWGIVALIFVASIFGIFKLVTSDQVVGVSGQMQESITESDWKKGNLDASLVLVEYSDFQCPACANYYPILKELNEEFSDSLMFVYRHFPLKQIHEQAELAARASEAAGRQDKFWEMHDLLFENQKSWAGKRNAEDIFIDYATSLELDIEQFKNDLKSGEVKDKVNNDYNGGVRSGVNSTPSFFINGARIQNPRNFNEFAELINNGL